MLSLHCNRIHYFLGVQCRKPKKTQQALKPKSTTELSSITVDDSVSFDPTLQFSMIELRVATKDFSADLIINDGRFCLVYKARLSNGVTMAIKRLDPDALKGSREFCTEMVTLGMLRHPKIVKILDYCMTGSDRLLTYEFIQNGCLDQWLQQEQNVTTPMYFWRTRIQIVRDVANGLSFLHGLDIVHRDIKSSNVLLYSDFQSHISDFGLARRIDSSTSYASNQSAGTVSYMPPEYKESLATASLGFCISCNRHISPPLLEADVYSFGVLMLEIATGKVETTQFAYPFGWERGWASPMG